MNRGSRGRSGRRGGAKSALGRDGRRRGRRGRSTSGDEGLLALAAHLRSLSTRGEVSGRGRDDGGGSDLVSALLLFSGLRLFLTGVFITAVSGNPLFVALFNLLLFAPMAAEYVRSADDGPGRRGDPSLTDRFAGAVTDLGRATPSLSNSSHRRTSSRRRRRRRSGSQLRAAVSGLLGRRSGRGRTRTRGRSGSSVRAKILRAVARLRGSSGSSQRL